MSNNNESAKKLSAKLFAAYETERAMKWLHGQNKEFAEKYPAGTPQPEQGETYWIIKNLLNIISDLKATSPRDWTPCAEGLPTKTADYKVTVQVGSEMGTWRETKIIPYRIVDGVGEWILPKSDWLIYGVIAWTKADEPWTGGLDGK